MDPIRKIPKMFTKKFGNKVINRQYFCGKTRLKCEYASNPNTSVYFPNPLNPRIC